MLRDLNRVSRYALWLIGLYYCGLLNRWSTHFHVLFYMGYLILSNVVSQGFPEQGSRFHRQSFSAPLLLPSQLSLFNSHKCRDLLLIYHSMVRLKYAVCSKLQFYIPCVCFGNAFHLIKLKKKHFSFFQEAILFI